MKNKPGAPKGNKNAAVDPRERRTVKKLVTFSPDDWELVQEVMQESGETQLTRLVRRRLIK